MMEKDPVCGMDVDPRTATQKADHNSKTYYFCGPGCKKAFLANPGTFLAPGFKAHM
jgi:YHS domain-containing protein